MSETSNETTPLPTQPPVEPSGTADTPDVPSPLIAPPDTTANLQQHRGVVVATVIWGVAVTLVALTVMSLVLGASFDLGLALIVTLTVGGVALLVGAVVGGARRRRSPSSRG